MHGGQRARSRHRPRARSPRSEIFTCCSGETRRDASREVSLTSGAVRGDPARQVRDCSAVRSPPGLTHLPVEESFPREEYENCRRIVEHLATTLTAPRTASSREQFSLSSLFLFLLFLLFSFVSFFVFFFQSFFRNPRAHARASHTIINNILEKAAARWDGKAVGLPHEQKKQECRDVRWRRSPRTPYCCWM